MTRLAGHQAMPKGMAMDKTMINYKKREICPRNLCHSKKKE
jgi:hypothetical protein